MDNLILTPSATTPQIGAPGMLFGNIFVPTVKPVDYTSLLLHFDGNTDDDSPKQHTPTLYGTPTFADGKSNGQAINFTASGQYVSYGNSSDFDLANTPWTIELLVYPTTSSSWRGFVVKRDGGSSAAYQLGLNQSDNRPTFYIGGSASIGNTSIPVNTWTHLAYVSDGSTYTKLFINGVLDVTWNTIVSRTISNLLTIGSYSGSEQFYGRIDELRILKGIEKYTANFTPALPPVPKSGLLAHYPLTADAADISGNSRNAAVNGSPVFDTNGASGFSPSNYISLPNNLLQRTSAWTISMKIKVNSASKCTIYYAEGATANSGRNVAFLNQSTNNSGWFVAYQYGADSAKLTFNPGTEYHVLFSWDGSVFRCVVDQVQQFTANYKDYSGAGITEHVLGLSPILYNGQGYGAFDGSIHDVRFYNRELTADEQSTLNMN